MSGNVRFVNTSAEAFVECACSELLEAIRKTLAMKVGASGERTGSFRVLC